MRRELPLQQGIGAGAALKCELDDAGAGSASEKQYSKGSHFPRYDPRRLAPDASDERRYSPPGPPPVYEVFA